MRRKALLFVALIFSVIFAVEFSAAAPLANDRVVIQKRKITIVRTGKLAREFPERRRATINMPVVSGLKPLSVLNKVRAHLTLKNIFDTSLAEYRQDTWLEELDFTVNYNKNYILDITFMQSGTGAYPDTHFKHLVINLKTGDIVKAKDVFNPSTSTTLTAMVDAKLQAELKQLVKDGQVFDGMNNEERQHIQELYKGLKFEAANLSEFQVSDTGLTFLYDAGFPHAIQALEPDGKYFFSYAELAPHIKPGSLLASFIK
jgi:hypothetical protein